MRSVLLDLLALRPRSCSPRIPRRSGSQWSVGGASASVLFGPPPQTRTPAVSLLAPRSPIRLFCAGSRPQPGQMAAAVAEPEFYNFGPYKIRQAEVFYTTSLTFAFVNLRPVLPDVLICPKREVKRFADLTADELGDLWLTAKQIGDRLEQYHKATSLTFTIQDGPQAGQTVPHVHIHILPRKAGDFENNDEIYDTIDGKEKELKEKLDLDKERKDRTPEEMAKEADEYRALFSR